MQVACILLPLCFMYDIFWVFITPVIMGGKSVMVEVRTLPHFKGSLRIGASLTDDAHWLCINALNVAYYKTAVQGTLDYPACDLFTASEGSDSQWACSGVSQA